MKKWYIYRQLSSEEAEELLPDEEPDYPRLPEDDDDDESPLEELDLEEDEGQESNEAYWDS